MTYEEMPPAMRALVLMLPPAGTDWPSGDRIRWLRAFDAVARLVFKDDTALEISRVNGEISKSDGL